MRKRFGWLFLYFVVLPFVLSFVSAVFFQMGESQELPLLFPLLPFIIGGFLAGLFPMKRLIEGNITETYIRFMVPLAYTGAFWAIFMLISGGFYGHESWLYFCLLHIPYLPIYFISTLMGEGRLFFFSPLFFELSLILGVIITLRKQGVWPSFKNKQLLIVLTVFFLAIGTGGAVHWHRSKTVLPPYGFKYAGGYSSTDLQPYEVYNPDNILPKLKEPSSFTIANRSEMPVLDGAEAAFPVYSAFANATYENISDMDLSMEKVTFMNTIYAYERLLTGDVDIYFGAEPSKEQREMAEQQGKELVMTPIGKEAFVFFVNPKNKVDSLKVSEVRSIYSGKIKNWSEVGGENEKIIAFQRPKNSGSQTLLEKIMANTPIMKPLKEDVPEGMGGIIEQVADYRNYDNALGFSFRFFATGMTGHPDIKLLAIDGIEPSPENISSEVYPFTANLYAITLKNNPNPKVSQFLEWMKGPQGQWIVEEVGYIPIK